jgi:pyochelin biosynthetic protein PchC
MLSERTRDDLWIRRFHPYDTGTVRLICFPHAGGAATYYRPLALDVAPGVEVLAVQYPGRQDRRGEAHLATIADLAEGVLTALTGWTDRSYAFFGHSLGAIIAFEVARRLERRTGVGPAWLFASGRRAPASRRPATAVHRLSDAGLLAELRRVGGTDPRVLDDEELAALILSTARADYRAIETYTYEPGVPLVCPITALLGDRDPQCTAEEAAIWTSHTTGPFDLRTYPGDHFYLDAHRPAIAQVVASSAVNMVHRR